MPPAKEGIHSVVNAIVSYRVELMSYRVFIAPPKHMIPPTPTLFEAVYATGQLMAYSDQTGVIR